MTKSPTPTTNHEIEHLAREMKKLRRDVDLIGLLAKIEELTLRVSKLEFGAEIDHK